MFGSKNSLSSRTWMYCTWKGLVRKIAWAPERGGIVRGAQAMFRAKTFHEQYPTFSTAVTLHTYPPMKMEHTQCSETLAFKLQTPENHPEESIRQICSALTNLPINNGDPYGTKLFICIPANWSIIINMVKQISQKQTCYVAVNNNVSDTSQQTGNQNEKKLQIKMQSGHISWSTTDNRVTYMNEENAHFTRSESTCLSIATWFPTELCSSGTLSTAGLWGRLPCWGPQKIC
jgi:hypothetical protein